MKIKPLGKRVLIKIIEDLPEKHGKILLFDSNKEKKYQVGEIIALSEDEKIKALFNLFDKVVFKKEKGVEVSTSYEERFILELDDVLGIIEKDDV